MVDKNSVPAAWLVMVFTLTQKRRSTIQLDHRAARSARIYSSSLVKGASRVMRTLSVTRNLPASMAAFQISPNYTRAYSVTTYKHDLVTTLDCTNRPTT